MTTIGVWDTVGSLGVPGLHGLVPLMDGLAYGFHDVALSAQVRYAFHALAIHERRVDFPPSLWCMPDGAPSAQVLEQVWFSGVHSDVGGGYPRGAVEEEPGWMARIKERFGRSEQEEEQRTANTSSLLSDVPLDWMMERTEKHAGLAYDRAILREQYGFAPEFGGAMHNSFKGFFALHTLLKARLGGAWRRFLGEPQKRTIETIHPSAEHHVREMRGEGFPNSFTAEFRRLGWL